jgi:hypothetical protein
MNCIKIVTIHPLVEKSSSAKRAWAQALARLAKIYGSS